MMIEAVMTNNSGIMTFTARSMPFWTPPYVMSQLISQMILNHVETTA